MFSLQMVCFYAYTLKETKNASSHYCSINYYDCYSPPSPPKKRDEEIKGKNSKHARKNTLQKN